MRALSFHIRFFPLFGVLLISVLAVSCAQTGADGSLPTSPSVASAGPSATALGPGATYDASGMWRFVTADRDGNVLETFDTAVSQDSNGNLSFVDAEGAPVTLERLGRGVIITYRLSVISNEDGDCDVRIQATVRLDTRSDTITAPLRLKSLCSNERQGLHVTATKLS